MDVYQRYSIYWHNGRSLGHTSRSSSIAKAIIDKNEFSTVIGITGASRGLNLLPEKMDILKIPSFLTFDDKDYITTSPILGITKREMQYFRENLIKCFLVDFSPNALIVDYHPQGRAGELVPAVISTPKVKKFLGLRGILGNRIETNSIFFSPSMTRFIKEFYSSILVYIDPKVFDIEDYYDIPKTISSMINYTGYVVRDVQGTKEECRKILNWSPESRIVTVNFGGGQGTKEIWQAILGTLSDPEVYKLYDQLFLITGPYIENDTYNIINDFCLDYGKWNLSKMIDNNFGNWIKSSDLFIGAAGYNTIAEVIQTKVNALLIPRQLHEQEQRIHVAKLESLGVLRVLKPEDLSESILKKTIQEAIHDPYPVGKHVISTNGAAQSAAIVDGFLQV